MSRQRAWFSILSILVIGLVGWLTARSLATPSIGEIQVLEPGPFKPDQRIVLSLAVESRGDVHYQWANPDGGVLEGGTNGSSARFVVPREGPARVICVVVVDGTRHERVFPVSVIAEQVSPVASAARDDAASATMVPQASGENADDFAVVLSGIRLGKGLGLGVDTSSRRRDWVAPTDDKSALKLAYPGDPVFGAVFFTVGRPVDTNRPGRDYSGFKTLDIEMKGAGGESVDIGVKDSGQRDDGLEAKVTYKLTSDWQVYSIPLSKFQGTNLRKLYVVCELVFGDKPATIHVRRIQFSR